MTGLEGTSQDPQLELGMKSSLHLSLLAPELLLHPAQGKTGTDQLDADETGPKTAGDGPGSCHQSGMH